MSKTQHFLSLKFITLCGCSTTVSGNLPSIRSYQQGTLQVSCNLLSLLQVEGKRADWDAVGLDALDIIREGILISPKMYEDHYLNSLRVWLPEPGACPCHVLSVPGLARFGSACGRL